MAGITGKDAVLTAYADALATNAPKGRSLTQDALRRLFTNTQSWNWAPPHRCMIMDYRFGQWVPA